MRDSDDNEEKLYFQESWGVRCSGKVYCGENHGLAKCLAE